VSRAGVKRSSLLRVLLLCAATAPTLACGSSTSVEHENAVQRGATLFVNHSASESRLNAFACSTCHAADATPSARILPGAPLSGSRTRATFWGGQDNDLLQAINDCRTLFMQSRAPWQAGDDAAESLWAYLETLPTEPSAAVAFTVVKSVADLPAGSATDGAQVYANACQSCHGTLHDGQGRISSLAPRLPDDTKEEHAEFSATDQRVIFVEKMRHGGFLGYGGIMPPFSAETLSDAQVADLLSLFELY